MQVLRLSRYQPIFASVLAVGALFVIVLALRESTQDFEQHRTRIVEALIEERHLDEAQAELDRCTWFNPGLGEHLRFQIREAARRQPGCREPLKETDDSVSLQKVIKAENDAIEWELKRSLQGKQKSVQKYLCAEKFQPELVQMSKFTDSELQTLAYVCFSQAGYSSPDRALQLLRAAEIYGYNQGDVNRSRALVLYKMEKKDAAIRAAEKVVDKRKTCESYELLSTLNYRAGQFVEALRNVDRGLSIHDQTHLHLLKSRILMALGRYSEACSEIEYAWPKSFDQYYNPGELMMLRAAGNLGVSKKDQARNYLLEAAHLMYEEAHINRRDKALAFMNNLDKITPADIIKSTNAGLMMTVDDWEIDARGCRW